MQSMEGESDFVQLAPVDEAQVESLCSVTGKEIVLVKRLWKCSLSSYFPVHRNRCSMYLTHDDKALADGRFS